MSSIIKFGIANYGDLDDVIEMDTIDEAAASLNSQYGDRLAVWQNGVWSFYGV